MGLAEISPTFWIGLTCALRVVDATPMAATSEKANVRGSVAAIAVLRELLTDIETPSKFLMRLQRRPRCLSRDALSWNTFAELPTAIHKK